MTVEATKDQSSYWDGFHHVIRMVRGYKRSDENTWSNRMQRLLAKKIAGFESLQNPQVTQTIHDAYILKRTAYQHRLTVEESDERLSTVLTPPIKARERRIVNQALDIITAVLPLPGAKPFYEGGVVTVRMPWEKTQNGVFRIPEIGEIITQVGNDGIEDEPIKLEVNEVPADMPRFEDEQVDWLSLLK